MKTKTKKILFKLFNLIIIMLVVLNIITALMGTGGISYGADGSNSFPELVSQYGGPVMSGALYITALAFHGIPLLIIMAIKLLAIVAGLIGLLLMSGVLAGFEGNLSNKLVTLEDIIFAGSSKGSAFLDVNFFNFSSNIDGMTLSFRESVATWYYILRLISAAALLVILIYVGIRMALATVGEEKARYKEMFVDWVQSVALLFLLHYIIIFFIRINSAFVNIFANMLGDGPSATTQLYEVLLQNVFMSAIGGILAAVIFFILVGQILGFFIIYVKRMVTIGFLIMISPLITITYSIDKMGDKKAQALNAWMKELAYNILIQPFHCVIFLAFYSLLAQMLADNRFGLAPYVLAIIIINFMRKAEDILKHIFHFEAKHMSSMTDAAQVIANANGAFFNIGKNVTKGAAAFTAAGGVTGLKNAIQNQKISDTAKKETKKDFKAQQKTGIKNFKEYLESEEGKQKFEEHKATTAKEMAEKSKRAKEKKEKKIQEERENEIREKVDEQYGEGTYDAFKNADPNNSPASIQDKYGNDIDKQEFENIEKEARQEVLYDEKYGKGQYQKDKENIDKNKIIKAKFEDIMDEDAKNKIQQAIESDNPDSGNDKAMKAVINGTYKDKDGKTASFEEIAKQLKDPNVSDEQKSKLREQINKKYYDEKAKTKNNAPDYETGKSAADNYENTKKNFEDKQKEARDNPGKPKKEIRGFKKYWDSLDPDMRKYYKAAVEDSSKVVGALSLGGFAYGATGNLQNAISAGQFGYGIVDGAWQNSSNTVVKDAVDKMEKILKVTDKNHDQIEKLAKEIKELNSLGMLDMKDIKKDFKEVLGAYFDDKTKRQLINEMVSAFGKEGTDEIDEKKFFEKITAKSNRPVLPDDVEDKIKKGLHEFLVNVSMVEYANSITKAEKVGMQSSTLSQKVEKTIIKNVKKVNITNNTTNNTTNNNTTIHNNNTPHTPSNGGNSN